MKSAFAKSLSSQLEGVLKKRLSAMGKQMRMDALSMTLDSSVEPAGPPSPPVKDLSSPDAVFGAKNLTQQLRFPTGKEAPSASFAQSSQQTFQRLTAPPRTSNLSEDVMLQAEAAPKGMVSGKKRRDKVWDESLKKKQRMKQRMISRARRRMGS